MRPVFITGIGTDVGKTIVAAIVTQALGARYWKPVQAGFADGTDPQRVARLANLSEERIIPERYRLALPASPHIAARTENTRIDVPSITTAYQQLPPGPLVVEGAGGLLVPLNETETVADLIRALDAVTILVSRNYLGSINHSLLTAAWCRTNGLPVAGWIFNDQFMDYESDIVRLSGYPSLGTIPHLQAPHAENISEHARRLRPALLEALQPFMPEGWLATRQHAGNA